MSDKLMYIGGFSAVFAGFLWLRGPAVNSAQFAFRVGLLVVGLAIFGAGWMLRTKNR